MRNLARHHAIPGGALLAALLALLLPGLFACGGEDGGTAGPTTTVGAGGAPSGTTGTTASSGSTPAGVGGAGGFMMPCNPDEDPASCGEPGGNGGMGGGGLGGVGGAGGAGGGVACTEPPSVSWSQSFGDSQVQEGLAIAVDPCGNTIVTGRFKGTMDLGGPLTSAGDFDVFVAKLDPAGVPLWSKRFGDTLEQNGRAVALDSAGNIILAGDFRGTIDFGGWPLSADDSDMFIAKLDPDGNHLWSHGIGGAGRQIAHDVAVDPADHIVIVGAMMGTLSFGNITMASVGGYDAVVLKLAPHGLPLWAARFGNSGEQKANAVSTDDQGRIFLLGDFSGGIDFGGGPRVSAGWPNQSHPDVFLAVFDENGSYVCDIQAGGPQAQHGWAIAVGADGNAVVTGQFAGSIAFGATTLETGSSTDPGDIFLAKIGPDCSTHWAQRFGDGSAQGGRAVAVDGIGSIWVTGMFRGEVSFGGSTLTSSGDADAFVAKFDPGGAHLFSDRGGDLAEQVGTAIGGGPDGHASMAGHCKGTMGFTGQPVVQCGNASNVFFSRIH